MNNRLYLNHKTIKRLHRTSIQKPAAAGLRTLITRTSCRLFQSCRSRTEDLFKEISVCSLTFDPFNMWPDDVIQAGPDIFHTLTWERRELDSLCVCCRDLCWLDHQVRLNHLRLRRVEREAEVHGELVQGQREAGHKIYPKYKYIHLQDKTLNINVVSYSPGMFQVHPDASSHLWFLFIFRNFIELRSLIFTQLDTRCRRAGGDLKTLFTPE